MTLKRLITPALIAAAFSVHAVDFRPADIDNADDYPTVAAVRHSSERLDRSNGKYNIKVFNQGASSTESAR